MRPSATDAEIETADDRDAHDVQRTCHYCPTYEGDVWDQHGLLASAREYRDDYEIAVCVWTDASDAYRYGDASFERPEPDRSDVYDIVSVAYTEDWPDRLDEQLRAEGWLVRHDP